jgi:hypothetical protein
MLQNAVGEVNALSYVKQIGDQDVARGFPALEYDSYMELLLLVCSTYNKKTAQPGKQKRAAYACKIEDDDHSYHGDDDCCDGYAVYNIDTNIGDIMVNSTNTSRFGNNSKFVPREEWAKMPQEERDRLIAKQRQEQMNSIGGNRKPTSSARQANIHNIGDYVDLDNIIDYESIITMLIRRKRLTTKLIQVVVTSY